MNKKVIFVALTSLFLIGCASKPEVVVKTKYIPVIPEMPVYKPVEFNQTLSYHFFNEDNKVCVKEWGNVCIPKQEMVKLIVYIKNLKNKLGVCNTEIKGYLQFRENLLKRKK